MSSKSFYSTIREFERLIKKSNAIPWEIEPHITYKINYNEITKNYLIDIFYNNKKSGTKDEIHREINLEDDKCKTSLQEAKVLLWWFTDLIAIFMNKHKREVMLDWNEEKRCYELMKFDE